MKQLIVLLSLRIRFAKNWRVFLCCFSDLKCQTLFIDVYNLNLNCFRKIQNAAWKSYKMFFSEGLQ